MNINNYFNLNRFFLILKNDIIRNGKTYLLTLGAFAGIITGIDILPGIITGKTMVPYHMYIPLFVFVGFIFSSIVFNEMHEPQKGFVFLITPASSLEKFFSKLAITSILYVIVMYIFFHILTFLLNGINGIFFEGETQSFIFNWTIIRIYLITQSIFLFASSYFRKNALIKLIFASFVIQMFFSFFSIINIKLFFDLSDFTKMNFENLDLSFMDLADFAKNAFYASKFIFLWVLAPFLWLLTFLRITEKEV